MLNWLFDRYINYVMPIFVTCVVFAIVPGVLFFLPPGVPLAGAFADAPLWNPMMRYFTWWMLASAIFFCPAITTMVLADRGDARAKQLMES